MEPSQERRVRAIVSKRNSCAPRPSRARAATNTSRGDGEEPRLAAHLGRMEAVIAGLLGVSLEQVNVKVTSTDGLGTLGRGEGIAALAVALLVRAGEDA